MKALAVILGAALALAIVLASTGGLRQCRAEPGGSIAATFNCPPG